jgi:hypothetical protein
MESVEKYFHGEKAESWLFIVLGIVTLALALYFVFMLKTSFWRGMAIPFIAVALLEFTVGITLVLRTPKDISRVENFITREPQKIETEEIPRMEKVMTQFVVFRYVEIALLIIGIFFMYQTKDDTLWRGIGFGLFTQASVVLILDFFAERRGHHYLKFLTDFTERL